MGKRKSCPVKRRPVIELEHFDLRDKTTYHGTETVRRFDKFDRRWFWENNVAIVFPARVSTAEPSSCLMLILTA